jgi:hypothetical protein
MHYGNLSKEEGFRRGGSDGRVRHCEGAGRKPTRNGIERRIVLLLEKNHCERLIDWRLVGGRGGRRLRWELSEAAIKEEDVLDGRYWLVTTLGDPPKNVIDTYRARDAVERGFRILLPPVEKLPVPPV